MPTATLTFDLDNPDDERQHRYALAGRDALIALEALDNHFRQMCKHGQINDETRKEFELVRQFIPAELIELLR